MNTLYKDFPLHDIAVAVLVIGMLLGTALKIFL
jgi:hypothetical protein